MTDDLDQTTTPSIRARRPGGIRLASALLVATTLLLAACGGSGFPDDPNAYLPSEVDGEEVSGETQFADQILDAVNENEQVEEVAVASVGGTADLSTPPSTQEGEQLDISQLLPSVVLVAAKTSSPDASPLADLVDEGEGEEVSSEKVEGVEVRVITAGGDQSQVAVAVAQPTPNIYLIALSLAGENATDAAKQGVTAMLEAGK